jgi:alpha/beta superfamily hydrolase
MKGKMEAAIIESDHFFSLKVSKVNKLIYLYVLFYQNLLQVKVIL